MQNTRLHVIRSLGFIEGDETVWYPSLIDFVICGQKYVEKETEVACSGIENPYIANADAVSSIFSRKQLGSWLPKGGSSFLGQKIFTIDLII